MPKIKNMKLVRDLRDRWLKDNYPQRMVLMFQAGVADAKEILDIPDEVIEELLEDKINRQEIFRWIITGLLDEDFDGDRFCLEPYYERFPEHQDKMLPFFQLILININVYKEKTWDPEFQNILHSISYVRDELRQGFNRLEEKQELALNKIDNVHAVVINTIGSVGFEDLKELLGEAKILTARRKAEERLKHAYSQAEKFELNAVIANSYIYENRGKESIPYLYASYSICEDKYKKNRLLALIKLFEENFYEASRLVEENIGSQGYTQKNIELLVNILLMQEEYEKCLELINEHGNSGNKLLKAQILLALNHIETIQVLADEELESNPESKDWLLMKAEAYVLSQEELFLGNKQVNPEEVLNLVTPLLERLEKDNENARMLTRAKELFASVYFRANRYSEAAMYYEEAYKLCNNEKKDFYIKNFIWANFLGKNWDNAISSLESEIKKSVRTDYVIMLARLYLQTGNPKQALTTMELYGGRLSPKQELSLEYYFLNIEILYRLVRPKDIMALINQLENTEQEILKEAIRGYYALLQDEWRIAIIHLEKALQLSDSNSNLEIKIQLIYAYRQRGTNYDYKKLREIIPTMPNWFINESFINDYVEALYQLNQYEEVLSFYYNTLKKPTVYIQEIVGSIYYQTKWYDDAKDIYEELFHQTNDIKYLFRTSNCLLQIGDIEGCLTCLQLAEKKVREDTSIFDLQLLSHAYLEVLDYEKSLEYAYLTFKHGEKNPDVWRFYSGHFLRVANFIPNISKQYSDAYQRIWKTFGETFPSEKELFKQISIEKDGKVSLDNLIDELKSLQSYQKETEKSFIQHRLPLQTFMEMINKNEPMLIWSHVAFNNRLQFSVSQEGSFGEVNRGVSNAVITKNVLCDLFSVFTLEYLDLLQYFADEFHVFIYQEQFSALFNECSDLKLSKDKGHKSISYENGMVRAFEWGPDEVEASIKKKEKVIDWINANCSKLGKAYINPEVETQRLSFEDQLQLCKDLNLSMMVDNFIIRDYGRQEYGVKTFSVADLITYLFLKKKIDKETHDELIGKLVIIGYRYMWVSPDVFIHFLSKNSFKLDGEVEALFGYLREEAVNREYVLDVVTQIINWYSQMVVEGRDVLIGYLCDVTVGEVREIGMIDKLVDSIEKMLPENEGKNEVLKIIKRKMIN
jgi:hypothetical protein